MCPSSYDYNDVQGFVSIENALFGNITELTNLGDAEHIGFEIDSIWTPSNIPSFSLQFSSAWLEAQITESTLLAANQNDFLNNIERRARTFAPEFSFLMNISSRRKYHE